MNAGPQLVLIGAVAAVGVLHTIVPDHWVPITLIARQRGWSKGETARAAFRAGLGHVLSTLLIAAAVWLAGTAVATHLGHVVDVAASLALVGFGGWIAISAWREMCAHHGHRHGRSHDLAYQGDIRGPALQRIATGRGELALSIYEADGPPRFRLTGAGIDEAAVATRRPDGRRQTFLFANHGTFWQATEEIPEPHDFDAVITLRQGDEVRSFTMHFVEQAYEQEHGDGRARGHRHGHAQAAIGAPHPAPPRDEVAVLARHIHSHRHGRGMPHVHWHGHTAETMHRISTAAETEPPLHDHQHSTSGRGALLLILGSSPMVEGIPAFFAAGRYGAGLIVAMSVVFALSTIATYVLLCLFSTAGLQRVRLGALERYGEVLSGALIAFVGVVFWIWPVL